MGLDKMKSNSVKLTFGPETFNATMKLILVAIVSLTLGLVAAIPRANQEEDDLKISEYFRNLLVKFRELMPIGNEEIGMPILDPLMDKNRTVSWDDTDFFGFLICAGSANSWSGVVTGLSTFVIKDVITTTDEWATTLKFILDFPDYVHTGSYASEGRVPIGLGSNLEIVGLGTYRVEATMSNENGTYPWEGSSHEIEISGWLNLNEDGTMWLQSLHGYTTHYEFRKSEVEGLKPLLSIPITDPIQQKLDFYGNDYMTFDIDHDGRNEMYKGLSDYLHWAFEGVLYEDIINGTLRS